MSVLKRSLGTNELDNKHILNQNKFLECFYFDGQERKRVPSSNPESGFFESIKTKLFIFMDFDLSNY